MSWKDNELWRCFNCGATLGRIMVRGLPGTFQISTSASKLHVIGGMSLTICSGCGSVQVPQQVPLERGRVTCEKL